MAGAGGHTFLAYADAVRGSARRNRDGRVLGRDLGRNRRSGGLFGRNGRIGRCLVGDLLRRLLGFRGGRGRLLWRKGRSGRRFRCGCRIGRRHLGSSLRWLLGWRGRTGHLLGRFGRHLWRLFRRDGRVRRCLLGSLLRWLFWVRGGRGRLLGPFGRFVLLLLGCLLFLGRLPLVPGRLLRLLGRLVRPVLGRGFRGTLRVAAPRPRPRPGAGAAAHGRPAASSTASRTPRSRRPPAAGRRPARSGSRH